MNSVCAYTRLRAIGLCIITAAILLAPMPGVSSELKVAIMDFESVLAPAKMGLAISEILRTELGQLRNITFIERGMIDQILEEQELQRSGLIDLDDVVKAGNLMGAEFVIVGSVVATGPIYTINSRCVDVQSGVVKVAKSIRVETAEQIPEMLKKLSMDIGKVLPATKPFLFSFEDRNETMGWMRNYDDRSVGISWVERHASHGDHALRIELPHTEYPGVHNKSFPKDWEPYNVLQADVFLEKGDAGQVVLVIRIDDIHSQSYHDRFHASFTLNPGPNSIELPVAKVREKLDCSTIHDVFFFLHEPQGPATLYLDNIRLAR